MMTIDRRRLCLMLLALPLAACASAEPKWYRLTPVAGPVRAGLSVRVELRDVQLASALDRPGIVRTAGATRLVVADGERWAAPLDDMVTHVLARDLGQRLPDCSISRERPGLAADPQVAMTVEIDRLEADIDGQAVLSARFVIHLTGGGHDRREGRVERRLAPAAPGADALVQALSEVLGRLADDMAGQLSILQQKEI